MVQIVRDIRNFSIESFGETKKFVYLWEIALFWIEWIYFPFLWTIVAIIAKRLLRLFIETKNWTSTSFNCIYTCTYIYIDLTFRELNVQCNNIYICAFTLHICTSVYPLDVTFQQKFNLLEILSIILQNYKKERKDKSPQMQYYQSSHFQIYHRKIAP